MPTYASTSEPKTGTTTAHGPTGHRGERRCCHGPLIRDAKEQIPEAMHRRSRLEGAGRRPWARSTPRRCAGTTRCMCRHGVTSAWTESILATGHRRGCFQQGEGVAAGCYPCLPCLLKNDDDDDDSKPVATMRDGGACRRFLVTTCHGSSDHLPYRHC